MFAYQQRLYGGKADEIVYAIVAGEKVGAALALGEISEKVAYKEQNPEKYKNTYQKMETDRYANVEKWKDPKHMSLR